MTAPPTDVLTMGRVSVDVYPDQAGPLEDVKTFRTYLGGSPTNVAVAAARHGRHAAVITAVGDDPFGRIVIRELAKFGVDSRFLLARSGMKTPLAFCEMFPPDHFPLYFYRDHAPDMSLSATDLDLDAVRAAEVFWVTATGLSAEPSRTTTFAALEARERRRFTILDLDYRPMLWSSPEETRRHVRPAVTMADITVGNMEEYEAALGVGDPKAAAQAALDHGVTLAVVKRGPAGVLALTAGGFIEVPALEVDTVNGLGAGDAFGGALCHGLLSGWDLERTLTFANAAGAYVATQIACSDAMPTSTQVDHLINNSGGRP